MDEQKINRVTDLLVNGIDEQVIVSDYGLSYEELYGGIDYFKGSTWARGRLKHYCGGCANGICFCWPLVDEKYCPVGGYKPNCPLQIEGNS